MENTDKFEYVRYAISELLIAQEYKNDAFKEHWAEKVINEKLQLPSLNLQEKYKKNKIDFETENNIQEDVKELGLHPEKLW